MTAHLPVSADFCAVWRGCGLIGIALLACSSLAFAGAADSSAPEAEAAVSEFMLSTLAAAPAFGSHLPAPNAVEVPKRLFGIIPNFRADRYESEYIPLTTAQKFELARQDSFDGPNYLLLVGYAMQSQMASKSSNHQSAGTSFASFYARSVADQIVGSYLTEALLPSAFHQDPRFFRLGQGTVWHRFSNAASWVVVSRQDNGHHGFAASELLGNAATVAIGNLYYPESRSAPESLERYGMAIGNDVLSNLLTEFWPDIRHRMPFTHHSHSAE